MSGAILISPFGGDAHMRKVISILAALAFALVFATIASAQGNGRLNGEIKDKDGNPWVDLTVEIKNPDTGQTLTLKTDKSGKFVQLGLRGGIYTITLLSLIRKLAFRTNHR
jgi:type 1 fimbria pilin